VMEIKFQTIQITDAMMSASLVKNIFISEFKVILNILMTYVSSSN